MSERETIKAILRDLREHPEKTCPMPEDTCCDGCRYDTEAGCDVVGRFADYLIANLGSIAPCKVGDTLFIVSRYYTGDFKVYECRVSDINIFSRITLIRLLGENNLIFSVNACELGKTVFRSQEDAEKALEGGLGHES